MHPDDTLDGYTLIRRIGAGGYGEVWLCRSLALGDLRALKFIAATRQDSLEREFKALTHYRKAAAKLRSPHLMPIEHVGRVPEGLFYVMPLADGNHAHPTDLDWTPQTLASEIARRREAPAWFSCEEISVRMRPVLEALQILSDAGFAHRDVKPDNILFCGGHPILSDLSLLDEDHADLSRCGTPGYVAPSWYQGGHPDMYGAAATLYTLLTGNLPDRMGRSAFNGPPQGDRSLTGEEPTRRQRLHAVIRRATREKVSERYVDFRAMAAALTDEAPSPPAPLPLRLMVVLAVAMLCGAALLLFLPTSPPSSGPATPQPTVSVAQSPSFAESIQPWMDRGDYAAALAAIEAHFRQDPGTKVDPAYSTARATALFHLNRHEEAREELRRAVPPTDAFGDVNTRQWLWEQLGDLAGAETDLTKLLAAFGPDALTFSMRAGIRARQGNFAGVHADWESARNIRDSDPDHLRLVDALWLPIKRQVPGYLEYLRAKGEDLPRLPWIWNIDDEPWVFDSFLSDTNCSREAHAARVHVCHELELAFRTGDHRTALIWLDRILDPMPARGNAADLSLLRALLLQRVGREPEMQAELGKACHRQLSWKRIDARIYLWDQLARWEDAEHFLTRMLEDPPGSAEDLDLKKLKLLKYRATLRARLGHFDAVSSDRSLAMESFGLQAERRAEVKQIWDTLAKEFPAYAAHLRAAPEQK